MFFQPPKKYVGTDLEGASGVLNTGFLMIPVLLGITLIRQLNQQDYQMSLVLSAGIVLALFTRFIFLKGLLKQSVMVVSILFTILLTIICSLGNGIHDIGLIGFPIIIGFSSILLDQKQMIAASVMSVLGLSWLVVGDQFNIFEPIVVPAGDTGDFIIASAMILIGGFVAFSLTTNMKNSLRNVHKEINASKLEADRLVEEVKHKEEIISEIHQAVINSLDQLAIIIENQTGLDQNQKTTYQSLDRKILVIKTAHEILLNDQSPLVLDLNQFTIEILEKFKSSLRAPELNLSIDKISYPVSVDQAIYFGICMIELLHKIDLSNQDSISLSLSSAKEVQLEITASNSFEIDEKELVVDLLIQQLKGQLAIQANALLLSFKKVMKK